MPRPKQNDKAQQCASCHAWIKPSNMERHKNTLKCKYRGRDRAIDKTQLVEVTHRHPLGMLAALGAIPNAKIITHTFVAYIPAEFATAYETFRKNNGFADLTVEEFLAKLGLINEVKPHENIKKPQQNHPKETLWR